MDATIGHNHQPSAIEHARGAFIIAIRYALGR